MDTKMKIAMGLLVLAMVFSAWITSGAEEFSVPMAKYSEDGKELLIGTLKYEKVPAPPVKIDPLIAAKIWLGELEKHAIDTIEGRYVWSFIPPRIQEKFHREEISWNGIGWAVSDIGYQDISISLKEYWGVGGVLFVMLVFFSFLVWRLNLWEKVLIYLSFLSVPAAVVFTGISINIESIDMSWKNPLIASSFWLILILIVFTKTNSGGLRMMPALLCGFVVLISLLVLTSHNELFFYFISDSTDSRIWLFIGWTQLFICIFCGAVILSPLTGLLVKFYRKAELKYAIEKVSIPAKKDGIDDFTTAATGGAAK